MALLLTGEPLFKINSMQEFLNTVLYPSLFAFAGVAATKLWDWVKPKSQVKLENSTVKSAEIDNEIKSATFYQNLLDDMSKRLEESILAIEKRDVRIKDRDDKIEKLIDEIEKLTDELRKYKQLNGKEH
jgi:septal ring factor EnvC (AmiA/AmiB activator)